MTLKGGDSGEASTSAEASASAVGARVSEKHVVTFMQTSKFTESLNAYLFSRPKVRTPNKTRLAAQAAVRKVKEKVGLSPRKSHRRRPVVVLQKI